jgi:glycogen debranching enzyme
VRSTTSVRGVEGHEGPTLYPVACAPQAWSAASVLLLFRACLGVAINGPEGQVVFMRPRLPASVDELRIHNLEVAGATVDLLLVRQHEGEASVTVLRRDPHTRILVVK